MSVAAKPSQPNASRRVWHTPTSKAALYWGLFALLFCVIFYLLYGILFNAPVFTGPWFDRIFRCGVMSYLMILAVSAYSLRTRFARNLPWKAQNWVWMHMWLGIAAVLLALLHEDYRFVLHGYCGNFSCVTDHYWGMPSLYGLLFIAIGGGIGRLLDMWQARVIARDSSTNGVGIVRAIKERQLEMEYSIERLCAGKSEPFKQYCALAITSVGLLPASVPQVAPQEQKDFQKVYEILKDYVRLAQSLQVQQRARFIFRIWRYVHMTLVPLALLVITYHAIAELLTNVLHIVKI